MVIYIIFICDSTICSYFDADLLLFVSQSYLRMFVIRWRELAKPLFCSIVQALTLFAMLFALVLLHALGYGLFSLPFFIDEFYCILILIFSIIFALSKPSKFSWLWAIFLFLFALPILRTAIKVLLANIHLFELFSLSFRSILGFGILLSLTFMQILSFAILTRNYFNQDIRKILKLFAIIFISHLLTAIIVDKISFQAQKYMGMHTPRAVRSNYWADEVRKIFNPL